MPSISLFNRRSPLSGDDLQPLCTVIIIIRLIQLLLLIPIVIYIIHAMSHNGLFEWWLYPPSSQSSCRNSHLFPLLFSCYAIGTLLFTIAASLIVEVKLLKRSSVGCPVQTSLRGDVPQLLEFKLLPLAIVQSIIFIMGLVAMSFARYYYECMGDDDASTKTLSVYSWSITTSILLIMQLIEFVSQFVTLLIIYCTPTNDAVGNNSTAMSLTPHSSSSFPEDDFDLYYHTTDSLWENRCKLCCRVSSLFTCYLFGGQNIDMGEYGDIARILSDYFEHGGVLDVTLSDLAVGMVALQRVQKERELVAREKVKSVVKVAGMATTTTGMGGAAASSGGGGGNGFFGECCPTGGDDNDETTKPTALLTPIASTDTPLTMTPDKINSSLSTTPPPPPPPPLSPSALTFKLQRRSSSSSQNLYYESKERQILSPHQPLDVRLIAEGARMARHSLAIYTWMLYVYMKPCTGWCRLLSKSPCVSCRSRRRKGGNKSKGEESLVNERASLNDAGGTTAASHTSSSPPPPPSNSSSSVLLGDNICQSHLNAVLLQSNLDRTDVIYAQFENGFAETPYYIALDHKWRSVVIAIRGTLSLEDCVVDVLVDPVELSSLGREFYGLEGEGEGEFCHNGVLRCVKWILSDLAKHNILDTLLSPNAKYSDYTLRITGHSLGAGCATILSFILKKKYPNLRCVNIAPPGGLLTYNSATKCKDYITSFVLHADLIPRLSVKNMEQLRDEVLSLIGRIKVPKYQVFRSTLSLGGIFCCDKSTTPTSEEERCDVLSSLNREMLLSEKDDHDDNIDTNNNNSSSSSNRLNPSSSNSYKLQLERFNDIQTRRKNQRNRNDVQLYPPGRIIHLMKVSETKTCRDKCIKCLTCNMSNTGSSYTPVWAENDDFGEIVVAPTMWTDHFPNRACLELEAVWERFRGEGGGCGGEGWGGDEVTVGGFV